jgi:LemA protein
MGLIAMGLLVVLLGMTVVVVLWAVAVYNALIAMRNTVDKEWSDIDILLKQRYDELPKLVETCKGYMAHERGTFEAITKARSAVAQAGTPAQRMEAENQITGALKTLFAVAENYPELKANQNFLQLQGRVTGLETDIARRRDEFNEAANFYNIRIAQVPDMIVARFLGFMKRDLFQAAAAEREDVKISFAQS